MKTFAMCKLLPGCLAVTLVLAGCSKAVLDYRNMQIVNGEIYPSNALVTQDDSSKPFSGTVTNFPDNQLLSGNQTGMKAFLHFVIFGTAQATGVNNAATQEPFVGFVVGAINAMCNVSVRDGMPDGHANCTVPNSNTPSTQMNFDQGNLDGDITYFDSTGNKIASGEFKDGAPTGNEKVYSPKTGKLIFEARWGKGVLDGKAKAYDPDSGALVYAANYTHGKVNGTVTQYSRDGKYKIRVESFVDGVLNGPLDTYDAATGAHTSHGTEVNGLLEGAAQTWNAQGRLLRTYVYKNGNDVTPISTGPVVCAADNSSNRILVETLICGSPSLRQDDVSLNVVYLRSLKSTNNPSAIESNQRDWVSGTRDKCTTVACLDSAYKDQIAAYVGPSEANSADQVHPIACSGMSAQFAPANIICSTPALMADDRDMDAAYKAAFTAVLAGGKEAIAAGVGQWSNDVLELCRDVACVDSAYRNLTAKLRSIATSPDAVISVSYLGSNSPAQGGRVDSTLLTAAPTPAGIPQAQNGTSAAAQFGSSIHASFDCAKASSAVENMICSDQILADYDVKLMQRYKAAMAASSDKTSLADAQRAWIARRDACTTLDCVSRAYQTRINQLNGSP